MSAAQATHHLRLAFGLRLLARDPLRYRRQLLALKQFFRGRHCAVLLLDDLTSSGRDLQVQHRAGCWCSSN
jgi:hypothetical protein